MLICIDIGKQGLPTMRPIFEFWGPVMGIFFLTPVKYYPIIQRRQEHDAFLHEDQRRVFTMKDGRYRMYKDPSGLTL
jgi:hypothetical protein